MEQGVLAALISDSKQSEYFSDYSLHGVEETTTEDAQANKQPTDNSGEKWYYIKTPAAAWVKMRMNLTEDQRQVKFAQIVAKLDKIFVNVRQKFCKICANCSKITQQLIISNIRCAQVQGCRIESLMTTVRRAPVLRWQ